MKSKWFCMAVLFPLCLRAQDPGKGSRLTIIGSAGITAGQSTAKPLFQWSGGLRYGRQFAGLGAGVDFYRFKSIPLFADWRMNFGRREPLFVYANGGYNIPFDNRVDYSVSKTTDRFTGGVYLDAGMGCRFSLSQRHRILFSAGYSLKNIVNKIGYTYPCLVPPCPEDVYRYHYSLERIVAKMSWEFGATKKK